MAREFDYAQGVCAENAPTTVYHNDQDADLDEYLCKMAEWYAEREWGGLVCLSDSLDRNL